MQSLAEFLARHPDYAASVRLDQLRATDFARLDNAGHVYLDFTGAGLHAASQLRAHAEMLEGAPLGNPHSASPTSSAATALVERTRAAVLRYFNATGRYTCVFTLNASNALKLVAEAYPFAPGGRLLLSTDNHNSVNGIREFASARGAAVDYAPLTRPELRLDLPATEALLAQPGATAPKLFAFPAQSNFSGVKHPLSLIQTAHAAGWDVLLDAAAFVPTNRLDLSQVEPDFVSVSFYKMFGYPTGVGCLLIRNDALDALRRPWFAGGTVSFVTVQGRQHILARGEAAFEDGTINFLSIPAVEIGLRHIEQLGLDTIGARVSALTALLLEELLALRHGNGRPMVRLYGPASMAARGGTIAMNFYDPDGHLLDYRRVEELAGLDNISLRTGCFCNPGAGETAEDLTADDMQAGLAHGREITLPLFLQIMQHRDGKSAGAVRVSLGQISNFADVERFIGFASGLRDQSVLAIGEVSFDIEGCRVIRDGS